jgi:hypothetical protein
MFRAFFNLHATTRTVLCLGLCYISALGADCLASTFREPTIPAAAFIYLDGRREGEHFQINFPDAANAGRERLIYWLTGDEDLVIDVQAAIGSFQARFPVTVTLVLLIDGVQTPFRVADSAPHISTQFTLETAGKAHRFEMRVAGRDIEAGGHSVGLVLWKQTGAQFPGVSFTVFKNGVEFSARTNCGCARRPLEGFAGTGLRWLREPGRFLYGRHADVQLQDGQLPLGAKLARQDSAGDMSELGFTLVAFLDGRQISIGSLGRTPHLTLERDEHVECEFVLRGLESGVGSMHVLVVYALPGDSEPAATPRGVPTLSARPPIWLGVARW